MDDFDDILRGVSLMEPIKCIDMHTTGEPTRIVYSGFPTLTGTLLEKRAQASKQYDHVRRRLMLEPRGHWDMYGAVLIRETELVTAGEADIGVLFMHNDGFSMMCGHATIALGRFLVDANESIFPRRKALEVDRRNSTVQLTLHVPSGLLNVTVPVLHNGHSDASRPVSFLSVPSFATGRSIEIPLPAEFRWPELGHRTSVTADFSYGGAFYCLIDAQELGFVDGLARVDLAQMSQATRLLKAAVNANPGLASCTTHVESGKAEPLYSVMVVDARTDNREVNGLANGNHDKYHAEQETGLCFFANQQIDRSPTGGCVAARVALAYTNGKLAVGEKRIYQSLLSKSNSGTGAFIGSVAEVLPSSGAERDQPQVRVRVEGQAFYSGSFTALVEETDGLANSGFALNQLACCQC
ncbi:hypothetical protein CLAIMM_05519 [Cladophialophora immunda]|nr:hypothetical protein CLAIMM_05519 [Cladophialophora immunda]